MRAPIDRQASLDSLRGGGLPLRAKQRLADEVGPDKQLFTSDLSVNEFLVVREAGCEPISQVMGSSIYHIGKIADYKGATGEIETISIAHRQARRLALTRLRLEAKAVNADCVVGVRLSERLITAGAHGKGGDDGDEVIEFTVVGTAVKAPWIDHPPGEPVLTDLTGQQLWVLAEEGFEPCGFLFEFIRYHVWHVMDPSQFQRGDEVAAAGAAVEEARKLAERRMIAQANDCKAEFVVGSDIRVTFDEVPCGYKSCPLADCDIDIVWFATAVRRHHAKVQPEHAQIPPLILAMMPLGRKRDGEIVEDGRDDDEALKEAAKEAEKEALERDGEGGE
jgi:uncharacterized protein YbjQ (UPF0145 family)